MAKESKSLIIFLAGEVQNYDSIQALIESKPFDFCAADGGYRLAEYFGKNPKYILGDFDSAPKPCAENVLVFPKEKDETDSELAINLALREGYDEIWMIAPFGGRLDHTIANLSLMDRCEQAGCKLYLYDGFNQACLLAEGEYSFDKPYQYISFFAYCQPSEITLKGFKYELDHYLLMPEISIGISNEPISENPIAHIYHGRVLCICIEKQ